MFCNGSSWILYSGAEVWNWEIRRGTRDKQRSEKRERQLKEKLRLHDAVEHLDRLSLTWKPARKIG